MEDHLTRMKKLQQPVKEWVEAGRVPTFELWATDYYIAEADISVVHARAR
jgi:hypothetical protein